MLRRIFSCLAVLALTGAGVAMLPVNPASGGSAPAITVDTTVDDGALEQCTDAPDDCSLRGALEGFAGSNHTDGVTIDITVPAGNYELEDEIHVHQLDVNVHGAGVDQTFVTIDRTGEDTLIRHLNLHGGEGTPVVTLSDMTFEGGNGDQEENAGGSILATEAELTVQRMHFLDNEIRGDGGAIAMYGNTNVDTLVIDDTTFAGNSASELGGAIHVSADETAAITNSTFTGNSAAFGGALYAGEFEEPVGTEVSFLHVTLAGNRAAGFQGDPAGGAIGVGEGTAVTIEGSLIEASVEGEPALRPAAVGDPIDNCYVVEGGSLVSLGHNIVDDDTCNATEATDQDDTAAGAQALGDNGGPTFTMALLAASPAVDAAGATCDVAADQRGTSRPQDGNGDGTNGCDAGAFELPAVVEPPAAEPAEVTPDFTG